MDLPRELNEKFRQEVEKLEEEKHMPYVTPFEQWAEERGLAKGLLTGIEAMLERDFGPDGLELLPAIQGLKSVESLQSLCQALRSGAKLEDVRNLLANAK